MTGKNEAKEVNAKNIFSIYDIAKMCHEVNKIYCESIGDTSQPSWKDAPNWQKISAFNGVIFAINNDVSPEDSHKNWMDQKMKDGWKYGPIKDPEKKEHPCMVPYNELPKEQRIKDALFLAIVNATRDKISLS